MKLMTIGYEKLTPKQFYEALRQAGVSLLIDVRENPISRKPGFSKNTLKHAALEAGIAYQHISVLGCPRDIRLRYRENAERRKFEPIEGRA